MLNLDVNSFDPILFLDFGEAVYILVSFIVSVFHFEKRNS